MNTLRLAASVGLVGVAALVAIACKGGPGDISDISVDGPIVGNGGTAQQVSTSEPPENNPTPSPTTTTVPTTTATATSTSPPDEAPAPAPFACGTNTCQTTQFCVTPCCTSINDCYAYDAGPCPTGYHAAVCPSNQQQGCERDPCTPTPPYCVSRKTSAPSTCQTENSPRQLTCTCN